MTVKKPAKKGSSKKVPVKRSKRLGSSKKEIKKITDRATAYATAVVSGNIIAGPYVRASCQRHIHDLERSKINDPAFPYYYDENEAAEAIAFFEECLCLNGGQFEGKPFLLLPWQDFVMGSIFGWKRNNDGMRRFRVAYIEAAKGCGKALSLDTPIPIPSGWTIMGKIQPGDRVFDENGNICNVIAATDVMAGHDCYRLRFSDGAEIVADAQHLWKTHSHRSDRKPKSMTVDGVTNNLAEWSRITGISIGTLWSRMHILGWSAEDVIGTTPEEGKCIRRHWQHDYSPNPKIAGAFRENKKELWTTKEISETLIAQPNGTTSLHPQAKWNHRVDVAPALNLPGIDLPIPPYSLGTWLGDGDSDCARITVAFSDWQIVEEVMAEGISVSEQKRHSETTARVAFGGDRSQKARRGSFQAKLRANNLLRNKHIPRVYFRAGTTQRLSLLQGIVDTDGHIAKGGNCEITLCDEALSRDVAELLRTLGYKCTIRESDAKLNGCTVGRRWRICFKAYRSQPPVRLRRKAEKLTDEPRTHSLCQGRMIIACDPVESVPVRCISVDSPSQMYLAGNEMVPTHNSPMAGAIGIKGLVADNEPRAEIYAAAVKQDQAMILFRDAIAFYDQSPELQARLIASGVGAMRWNLAYLDKGSFFRVISSEKRGISGPRPHMALLDEIHEHKDGSVIELLRAGFKFRRQPLSFMISNSGHDKTTVCWEYHEMGVKVALEQVQNDEFFSYICALDEEDLRDDAFLTNESSWVKTNPSLEAGIPGYDYIRGQVNEAKNMSSKMATVKRLCFCVWTEADNPAFSADAWLACRDKDYPADILIGRRCWGGLDLSAVDDLTSLALVFEPQVQPKFKIDEETKRPVWESFTDEEIASHIANGLDPYWRLKVYFWIPADGIKNKEDVQHVPYIAWRDAGYIFTSPGMAISKTRVIQFIDAEIATKYDLQGIAYDRNRMKDLIEFASKGGIELDIGEWDKKKREWNFPGHSGIKMMPFGQEGRSMAPAIDKFELFLLQKLFRHDGNPCLNWNVASAVIKEDDDSYRKVMKNKSTGKVDGLVATVMACGVIDDSPAQVSMYADKSFDECVRLLTLQ